MTNERLNNDRVTSDRVTARILAIADSDSYVKWGAALLDSAGVPAEWERSLVVLASPLQPSPGQLAAAVAGTRWESSAPPVIELADFARLVADTRPDAVLLALRGPAIKVVLRAALAASPAGYRPIFVTGLPGISIPATAKAIAYRSQTDLMVLHSHREVRDFTELAERMRVPQRFALATLPFTRGPGAAHPDGPIVFAVQAKFPAERDDRMLVLSWLAETARRHPDRRVVIKVRAARGEAQTHHETHDYGELLPLLNPPAPPNLVLESGAMSRHLATASALVTISSTALIEAMAAGVPVLALNDFGVRHSLVNSVFLGSGVLGSSGDLRAARFSQPNADWLHDNYFHAPDDENWTAQLVETIAARDAGALPLRQQRRGTLGGPLREAWDRKRALGNHDRSVIGAVALILGWPLMKLAHAAHRSRSRLASNTWPFASTTSRSPISPANSPSSPVRTAASD